MAVPPDQMSPPRRRAVRSQPHRPFPQPSPPRSLSLPADPRARAGRARPEPAGQAGASTAPLVDGAPQGPPGVSPAPTAPPTGLAVVLRFPVRDVPVPPHPEGRDGGRGGTRPVSLAVARARRRGPLAQAADDQRRRRLARRLHPAGVDRTHRTHPAGVDRA
jgi:hypothetical protein